MGRICRMMRHCALLCLAVAAAAQTAQWKQYSYAMDGFQASYPSMPDIQKKNVDTEAGTFELRSYTASAGDAALFVGVCDYGVKIAGTDVGTLLQGAKNGALANANAHLVSERKIRLGNYPGLQFEAESEAAHFTARIYMAGSVLYQTLVVFPISKPYDQATRFLDSFQLIAKTTEKPDNRAILSGPE